MEHIGLNPTFIAPLEARGAGHDSRSPGAVESSAFAGIFRSALENVTTSQQELEHQQYLLATGQLDDAHTVSIAAAEAQLSVDLLVQLRNKSVEAYNELIRISL